ncbi:hypothetical protein Ciccas_011287 [Cichlidogyrus casuarinus]|uniref:Tetraspanin n=1 Tax=Cichlidogyrus casuarinus TaxID=1844966 RepID=A0ABD2PSV9_9PLAT
MVKMAFVFSVVSGIVFISGMIYLEVRSLFSAVEMVTGFVGPAFMSICTFVSMKEVMSNCQGSFGYRKRPNLMRIMTELILLSLELSFLMGNLIFRTQMMASCAETLQLGIRTSLLTGSTGWMDQIQQDFHCCGITSANDWKQFTSVPQSCCPFSNCTTSNTSPTPAPSNPGLPPLPPLPSFGTATNPAPRKSEAGNFPEFDATEYEAEVDMPAMDVTEEEPEIEVSQNANSTKPEPAKAGVEMTQNNNSRPPFLRLPPLPSSPKKGSRPPPLPPLPVFTTPRPGGLDESNVFKDGCERKILERYKYLSRDLLVPASVLFGLQLSSILLLFLRSVFESQI